MWSVFFLIVCLTTASRLLRWSPFGLRSLSCNLSKNIQEYGVWRQAYQFGLRTLLLDLKIVSIDDG